MTERGDAEFGPTHCLLRSPGVLVGEARGGDSSVVRVYPNFSAVSRYALMAMEDRLSEIGVRKRRRRGEGSEFQQLREYREKTSPANRLARHRPRAQTYFARISGRTRSVRAVHARLRWAYARRMTLSHLTRP